MKINPELLYYPLLIFLTKIYETGIFPMALKYSNIIPVPKNDKITMSLINSRPVVTLSPFAEVVESSIYHQVWDIVFGKISSWQHGFMKGRSTSTNLMSFLQFVYPVLEEGNRVDTVYTDFTKAFDRVNFSKLITSLIKIGLPAWLCKVLVSYLTDRKNFVYSKNTYSDAFIPTSGVPQGSNLGRLLFIIFVNELDQGVGCEYLMYVDDARLFTKIKSVLDCWNLQESLNKFADNCKNLGLELNPSKCKICTYTRSS